MKILHVIVGLGTGGAELMLKRLAVAHADNPHYRHSVISLSDLGTVGPQLRASGVEVEALGMSSPAYAIVTLFKLTRRIREVRPDIVQCWMYHADLLGGLAARMAGCRRILWGIRIADITAGMGVSATTFHIRRLCARMSTRLPARILYVAEAARKVHEQLGYDPSKSIVIPNGYAIPDLSSIAESRSGLRTELGLADDAIVIASAGRFSPQKGYVGLIAAVRTLALADARIQLVIMGRDVNTDNPELMQWVAQSGYAERIHLLGERRDVVQSVVDSDIFVLNSNGEGFPNVVAEAMIASVPCIVTDVGDAAMLVGETGVSVPPGDPAALSHALARFVAMGAAARRALGMAGRRRVEENFSIATISKRYERLYDELVGDSALTSHLKKVT